ncbi:hypothetical protein, partial [Diplocloster modestus]
KNEVGEEIKGLKNEVGEEIKGLKNEVGEEIKGLKNEFMEEIKGLKNEFGEEIKGLKVDISSLRQEVKQDISSLKHDVLVLKLDNENDIIPRLQNIESCYISTYNRYKSSVETYDTMEADIKMLKEVVAEHSAKLQKIS